VEHLHLKALKIIQKVLQSPKVKHQRQKRQKILKNLHKKVENQRVTRKIRNLRLTQFQLRLQIQKILKNLHKKVEKRKENPKLKAKPKLNQKLKLKKPSQQKIQQDPNLPLLLEHT